MKLSELPLNDFVLDIQLHKDGSFVFASKLHTDLNDRLVPCNNIKAVTFANELPAISCLIVSPDIVDFVDSRKGCLVSINPLKALFEIHSFLADWHKGKSQNESIIHPTAKIHKSAIISDTDVEIGKDVIIGPHCVIESKVKIKEGSKLYQGCHIGCNPFDVNSQSNPQVALEPIGGVSIEKNVSMLSGAKVAKATFGGDTVIGSSTILDANVFVAHDCNIGVNAKIAAGAFIGGRSVIGDYAYVGPNVTISNGINIGSNSKVTLGAVVIEDVLDGETVTGHFAVPHLQWLRFFRRALK